MRRPHLVMLLLVAFIGGLVGGVVSVRCLSGDAAFATGEGYESRQKQIVAEKVIAEEFFLSEKRGQDIMDGEIPVALAIITTQPDGYPKLIMQDKEGNPRLVIGLGRETGASLTFTDAEGDQKVQMAESGPNNDPHPGPVLTLSDTGTGDGRRILLGLSQKDRAGISMRGMETGHAAELMVDSEDTRLLLRDEQGRIRAELGNTELAFGKDGILERVSQGLFTVDKRPASSLVLFDENGKVLWSAP